MIESAIPFEEPWPTAETQLVIDAVRTAIATLHIQSGVQYRIGDDGRLGASSDIDGFDGLLAEAGRRWALAHRSASLMRNRLEVLESSLATEVDVDAESAGFLRAWRLVTDAATWTSLNQLEQAALIDPLTGIGNRRSLDMMLTGAMSNARRNHTELVMVAIDLNGLKRINDSQGHAEGDRALIGLVEGIETGLRTSDTLFRTGGDEFAMVLLDISLSEVGALMDRISNGDVPAFAWGAASLADEHQHPADLLNAADLDLYRRRGLTRGAAPTDAAAPLRDPGPTRSEMAIGAAVAVAGAAVGVPKGAGKVRRNLHGPRNSAKAPVSRRTRLAVAAGIVAIGGAAIGGAALAIGGLAPSAHLQSAISPGHSSGHPRGINPIGPVGGTGSGGSSPTDLSTSGSVTGSAGSSGSIPTAGNRLGVATGFSGVGAASAQKSVNVAQTGPTGNGASANPATSGRQPVSASPPSPTRSTPPRSTPSSPPAPSSPPSPTSGLNGAVSGLVGTANNTVFGVVGLLGQTLGV